jgi:sentrin-specific protease 1
MTLINTIVPSVYCFNTALFTKLTGPNHADVLTWLKKQIENPKKDKLLIPVHTPGHWSLFVVNLRDKRFEYYDSLYDGFDLPDTFLPRLRKWLKDAGSLDTRDWKEVWVEEKMPKQSNVNDCGVFVMVKALFVAADLSSTGVRPEDMPSWRRAIAAHLLRPPASQLHFFL